MARTSFAQNGLVRLAYEEIGEGSHCVVLLHGLLSDRAAMRPVADALEERTSVVIPDMRGHGGSSAIHGVDLRIDDLARDVIAILDATGHDSPVCIVGVEVGAVVAQRLQQLEPNRVAEVVLVNLPENISDDASELLAIADRAYKGQIESAVNAWLNRSWGPDWQTTVPKPRVAAARRSAQALHPVVTALVDAEIGEHPSLQVPGGTPFADEANVDAVITALELSV